MASYIGIVYAILLTILINSTSSISTNKQASQYSHSQEQGESSSSASSSLVNLSNANNDSSNNEQVVEVSSNSAKIDPQMPLLSFPSTSDQQLSDDHDRSSTKLPLLELTNSSTDASNNVTSETVPPYMQHMTSVLVILHMSVFISGLVGNALVCLSVYRNKSLQTVTNYYIVNLAVADFLVILICLPPTVYWDLTLTWNFGLVLCKLVLYLQSTSVSVSVLTLTCISIDRWYAICRPLEFSSTKSRAKVIIGLIWLASMVIASPDVLFLTTRPLYEENGFVYMDCTHSWPENNTKIYQLCITTLLFVCPFVLMIISYSHIVNVLWRNENMTELLQHSSRSVDEKRTSLRCLDKRNSISLMTTSETAARSSTGNLQIDKLQQQTLKKVQREETRKVMGEIGVLKVESQQHKPKLDALPSRGHLNVINSNISAQSIPEEPFERNLSLGEGKVEDLSTLEAHRPSICEEESFNGAELNPLVSVLAKKEREVKVNDRRESSKVFLASTESQCSNSSESIETKSQGYKTNVIASTDMLPSIISGKTGPSNNENCCKLEQYEQLNSQLAYEQVTQSECKQSSIAEDSVKNLHPIVISLEPIDQSKARLSLLLEKSQKSTLDEVSDDINCLAKRANLYDFESKHHFNPDDLKSCPPLISPDEDFFNRRKTSNPSCASIYKDKELEEEGGTTKITGPSQCKDTARIALEKRSKLVISTTCTSEAIHLMSANIVGSSDSEIELKHHRGIKCPTRSTKDLSASPDKGLTTSTLSSSDKVKHMSSIEPTLKAQQSQRGVKNCWKCLFSKSEKKSLSLNEDKFLGMSNKSYKRYKKNLSNYAAKQVKYGKENSVTSFTASNTGLSLHHKVVDINYNCPVQKRASKVSCHRSLERPTLILDQSEGESVAAGAEITAYSDDVGSTSLAGTCDKPSYPQRKSTLDQQSTSRARFNKLIESRKKAAKMLIVIVIMFGLCYLPVHFLNTLRCTIGLPQNNLITIASLVSHWLCYFNSAVNPLIYNLMSGKFRQEFANLFFCQY